MQVFLKIFVLLISLLHISSIIPGCIDYSPSSSLCHICSFDYFQNYSQNIWLSNVYFPLSSCVLKHSDIFNMTIYINSDKMCNINTICDGTTSTPYSNIFDVFSIIMINARQYKKSNIYIKLLGSKTHYLYNTTNEISNFEFFRRLYMNLTIITVYCDEENVVGCIINRDKKAIIELKSDNMMMFVSWCFYMKNIKLTSSDMNLYYSGIIYQNLSKCDESSLFSLNNDQILKNCYIYKENVSINKNYAYGFINLEFLIDCSICEKPQLSIKNCEIFNFFSFNSNGNSLISFVNVLRPYFANITIDNSIFQRIFFYKGILFTNTNADGFYLNVNDNDMSNYLQNVVNLNNNFNFNISNSLILEYNFYLFLVNEVNLLTLFYYNFLNQVLNNIFISFANNSFEDINQTYYSKSFSFIYLNYVNLLSILLFDNCSFNNNSFYYFIYIETNVKINSIKLRNSYFINNTNLVMVLKQNTLYFHNNTIDIHYLEGSFINMQKSILFIKNSDFNNISSISIMPLIDIYPASTSTTSIFDINYKYSRNLTFDQIFIDNLTYTNITNIPITNTKSVIRDIFIENSFFDMVNVSKIYPMLSIVVENTILIRNSTFNRIFASYVFSHDYCRNRTYNVISFQNSDSAFLKCFSINYANLYHYLKMIFINVTFQNIIISSSNIPNIIDSTINYIGDVLDCIFVDIVLNKISYTSMNGNIIYIQHCSYTWFADIIVQSIRKASFLYLFNHNKVNYDGQVVKPIVNCSNIIVNNNLGQMVYFISFQTMYYIYFNNCYFISTLILQNNWAISSNCFPGCFIVIKDCIFEKIQSLDFGALYLTYQNIQSISIINSKFLNNIGNGKNSADLKVTFQEQILLIDKPFYNFNSDLKKFNLNSTNNFTFQYNKILNFFDFFSVWNNSNTTYGLKSCELINSYGTSINIDSGNDMFISNCFFFQIPSISYGIIYLYTNTRLSIVDSVIYNCSSSGISGFVFLDKDSISYFRNLTITMLSAYDKGGVFYLQSAIITIINIVFKNILAKEGGVLYAYNSKINVINCSLYDSSVSAQGTFIYSEKSDLYIENSNFNNCDSDEQGAVISLQFMTNVYVKNSGFYRNKAFNGIVYMTGLLKYQYVFENTSFVENNVMYRGGCFYLREGQLILNKTNFFNNTVFEGLIYGYSSFSIFYLKMYDNTATYNHVNVSYFTFISGDIILSNFSVLNNDPNYFFDVSSSEICISNSYVEFNESNILYNYDYYLYASFSNISLYNLNLNMHQNIGGLNCNKCLIISINNVSFFKGISYRGSAIYVTRSKVLLVSNSLFIKNQGITIYTENTNLTILNSIFSENQAGSSDGSDIYSFNQISTISINIDIIDNSFINIDGTSIYIETIDRILLNNNIFSSNKNVSISTAVFFKDILKIDVFNSSFSSLKGLSGVTIMNLNENSINFLTVKNSNFYNCSTILGGAIYLSGSHNISLEKNEFYNNSANEDGGAIYLDCTSDICPKLNIIHNIFEYNIAKQSGGVILSKVVLDRKLFSDNIFLYNSASVGNDISTTANWFFLTDSPNIYYNILSIKDIEGNDKLSKIEIVSGQGFNLYMIIFDGMDNFLYNLNDGYFYLSFNTSSITILNNKAIVNNGKSSFQDIIVVATPGQNITGYINYIDSSNNILTYMISIYLRLCKKGEFYLNLQCIICQNLMYSLDMNPYLSGKTNCELCPQNSDCPGADLIIPHIDYWRMDENSSLIMKCLTTSVCPSQNEYYQINGSESLGLIKYNLTKTFKYQCAEGTYGNLCSNCEQSYGKDSNGICVKCSDNISLYVRYFGLFVMSLFFLSYQGYVALKFNDISSQHRSLLKLLMNHNYYLTFLGSTSFHEQIDTFFDFDNKYATIIPQELANFDCFLSGYVDKENIEIFKIIIFSFFPLFICLLIVIIRLTARGISVLTESFSKKKKKIKKLSSEYFKILFFSSIIVTFYGFYTRLIVNTFTLLKCLSLDDSNRTYLQSDPNIQCWDSNDWHLTIIYFIFLPNLFIWCLGWPITLYIILFAKKYHETKSILTNISKKKRFHMEPSVKSQESKNSIANEKKTWSLRFLSKRKLTTRSRTEILLSEKQSEQIFEGSALFNFLTIDYKHTFYYWEGFFYTSNLLITTLSVLGSNLNLMSQVCLFIFIYFIMLLLNEKLKPFRYDYINNIASFSYFVMIATVLLSIQTTEDFQENMYFSALIIINVLFYTIWGIAFLKLFFNSLFKNCVTTIKILYKRFIYPYQMDSIKKEKIIPKKDKLKDDKIKFLKKTNPL